jgi:hypothetical protein
MIRGYFEERRFEIRRGELRGCVRRKMIIEEENG